jgi:hypothetical protein
MFPGVHSTAPGVAGKSWTLAGLKMRTAWWQVDHHGGRHLGHLTSLGQLALVAQEARLGCILLAGLETASGDDFLLVPELDGEGARCSTG